MSECSGLYGKKLQQFGRMEELRLEILDLRSQLMMRSEEMRECGVPMYTGDPARILRWGRDEGVDYVFSNAQVIVALGLDKVACSVALIRLREDGMVEKVGKGLWRFL